MGIALGLLTISALAFLAYYANKKKLWIRYVGFLRSWRHPMSDTELMPSRQRRRFAQVGSSNSRRYSVSTRYRPLVNDEESGAIAMMPNDLDEPLLQSGESAADNDAL